MSTPRGIGRLLARASAPPVTLSTTSAQAGPAVPVAVAGPEPATTHEGVVTVAPRSEPVAARTPRTPRPVHVPRDAPASLPRDAEPTSSPLPQGRDAVDPDVLRPAEGPPASSAAPAAAAPASPAGADPEEDEAAQAPARTLRVDPPDPAPRPPLVVPEPTIPTAVRPADAPPDLASPPPERPEPVVPVQIGRIEVQVAAPATEPDPFAGLREVADGLTARRGGGW